MPRVRFAVAILALAALVLAAAPAQARYAAIVVDFETGRVLHETNADTENHPASLVKMMTLYLAFEALERGDITPDQELTASRRAEGMPASKLGLRAGQTITVRDTIMALITKSANDAAVVMAEALAGRESDFARLMTKKARALGMSQTRFRNASGLPNRYQRSTARDLATLARALIRDFPERYKLFATEEFSYDGRTYHNHNRLLRLYSGTDGIKTGYVRASGFNLVASATREDRRVIAVVLGGKTPRARDRHTAGLLDRGFKLLATLEPARPPAPPAPKPDVALAATPEAPAMAEDNAAQVADAAAPAAAEAPAPEIGSAETAAADLAWGVQVGAFYRYAPAKSRAVEAAQKLPDLLGTARVQVSHFTGQRGRIYRSRLVGLEEARARAACRQLAEIKFDCLVVRVGDRVAVDGDQVATN